ncbi:MAG: hypothetical protein K9J13_09105 [Saprospiraceae bacterium]|nr:hypothetical protein [Saprospiraceae bacterium]
MKNLVKAIFDSTTERIKNPFIGTLIVSWIIINWKAIAVLLFDDKNIIDRIIFIESNYVSLSNNLIWPIAVALIYIIVLPYIMLSLEWVIKTSTIKRKEYASEQSVIDIQLKQKLVKEEVELENIKANYQDKADLNKQIDRLNTEVLEMNSIIEERDNSVLRLERDLKDSKGLNNQLQRKIDEFKNDESTKAKSQLINAYLEFKKSGMFQYFLELGVSIVQEQKLPEKLPANIKRMYIDDQIIIERSVLGTKLHEYNFSKKGEYFWEQLNVEKKFDKTGFIK